MNYYKTLGVEANGSPEEIRQAYHAMAKKYHPDVYHGSKSYATQKMKKINAAYEILKDPDARRQYDQELAMTPKKQRAARTRRTSTVRRTKKASRPADYAGAEAFREFTWAQDPLFQQAAGLFGSRAEIFDDFFEELFSSAEEDFFADSLSMFWSLMR